MFTNAISAIRDEVVPQIEKCRESCKNAQDKVAEVINEFDGKERDALEKFQHELETYEADSKAYQEAMDAYAADCAAQAEEAAKNGESYTPPSPPNITPPTPPTKPEINYEGRADLEASIDDICNVAAEAQDMLVQVDKALEYIDNTIRKCDEAEDIACRIIKFSFDRFLDNACQATANILHDAWKGNYVDNNLNYDSTPMRRIKVNGEYVYLDALIKNNKDGSVDYDATYTAIMDFVHNNPLDNEDRLQYVAELLSHTDALDIGRVGYMMSQLTNDGTLTEEQRKQFMDIYVNENREFKQSEEHKKNETLTDNLKDEIKDFLKGRKLKDLSDEELKQLKDYYKQLMALGIVDAEKYKEKIGKVEGTMGYQGYQDAVKAANDFKNGKKLSEMTDEELVQYKKLVENINKYKDKDYYRSGDALEHTLDKIEDIQIGRSVNLESDKTYTIEELECAIKYGGYSAHDVALYMRANGMEEKDYLAFCEAAHTAGYLSDAKFEEAQNQWLTNDLLDKYGTYDFKNGVYSSSNACYDGAHNVVTYGHMQYELVDDGKYHYPGDGKLTINEYNMLLYAAVHENGGSNTDAQHISEMVSAMLNSWEHGKCGNCTIEYWLEQECGVTGVVWSAGNGNDMNHLTDESYAAANAVIFDGVRTTTGIQWESESSDWRIKEHRDMFHNTMTTQNVRNSFGTYNYATGEVDYIVNADGSITYGDTTFYI